MIEGAKAHSPRVTIDEALTTSSAPKARQEYSVICVPRSFALGLHMKHEDPMSIIGGVSVSSGTSKQDIEIAQIDISIFWFNKTYLLNYCYLERRKIHFNSEEGVEI